MQLSLIMKINSDYNQIRFLKEYSYWYKYLNRNSNNYSLFVNEMKKVYKLTNIDKFDKVISNINNIRMFIDVFK